MIAVGSCNAEVTGTLLQVIMERSESEFKDTYARFLPLGLGLVYLARQEAAEAVVAALEVISEPFRSMATTMVEICAYAGTGNVLKIQQLLHICSEHYESAEKTDESSSKEKGKDKEKDKEAAAQKEKEDREKDLSSTQAVAVIGIALIAMGEEIGAEMAFRSFGNLLRYCEPIIRRSVPLALGLLSVSNPKLNILDTLSKFSHDSDVEVAHNSIFAMGLVGAGTNNARLASMLRQLAQYHAKDPNNLFMVRIAQGLTHLGKGTLSLSPYHSDRQLMCPVAVAGLLATLVSFLDVKNSKCLLLCTFTNPFGSRSDQFTNIFSIRFLSFSSHFGSFTLFIVHTGHGHAAPHVGHIRRRFEPIDGARTRWHCGRCGRTSRQTENHYRLSNAHHTCSIGNGRTC